MRVSNDLLSFAANDSYQPKKIDSDSKGLTLLSPMPNDRVSGFTGLVHLVVPREFTTIGKYPHEIFDRLTAIFTVF